jgi:bacterioferritin
VSKKPAASSDAKNSAKTGTDAKPFLTDVKALRARARKNIDDGAVTEGYVGNRESVLKLLNDALATEIVCVLRYRYHHFVASGIHADAIAAEFLVHSNEEQGHADLIAQRIVQLNGEPNMDPAALTSRSHSEYVKGANLHDMIKENLVAERIAIDSYKEMIAYIGDKDTTTKRMLEGILAVEEEHANELSDWLDGEWGK